MIEQRKLLIYKLSLLMRATVTVVVLTLLVLMLNACAPQETQEPSPTPMEAIGETAAPTVSGEEPTAPPPTEEVPTKPKALRVGIIGFPVAWDSAFATGNALRLTKLVLDPLVFIGDDLSPVPGLAKSWTTPDGGLTWEFELIETTWHDGAPFTSQDVKAHYERLLNPETGSPGASVYSMIESIEAPDPNFVRFHLNAPDMDFPILTGQYQGPIQAAHIDPTSFGEDAMLGTGPFMWDEVVPGESIRLVKNPNYFMEGVPRVDSLTFVSFDDETARLNALVEGVIDIAPAFPADLALQVGEFEDILLAESIPGTMLTAYLRADQEPGNDPRVMQALKLSVDREALVEVALHGFGTATPDNPIPPGAAFYVDVGMPERDIARAQALLSEAGYEDGLEFDMYVPVGATGSPEELALGIQAMAREAGFRINLIMLPYDILYAEHWLNVNSCIVTWSPRPTLDAQFRVAYTCEAAWNESHWCDPTFDAMLDEARGEPDPDKRSELHAEIQEHFAENGNTMIAYHFPLMAAYRKGVENLQEHPMLYYTDFRYVTINTP